MIIKTIKNRSDFVATSAEGKKCVTGTLILQMRMRDEAHPAGQTDTRFGFTVTKKIGNAVVRNRVKRRLREALRKVSPHHMQPGNDYVLISRQKAQHCAFSELTRDMEFAFSRIPSMKDTPKIKNI